MTQWSELRLHDGGPCPVGEDEEVRVITRSWWAVELSRKARAWIWGWNLPHQSQGSEIIAYQVALPESRDMQVPWAALRPEFRFAVVEECGDARVFMFEPYPSPDDGEWISPVDGDAGCKINHLIGYDPGTKPWDQSLIQRPEGVCNGEAE